MNAVMTFASAADQLQRYNSIRRRNAEAAYDRQAAYNGRNQKTLSELEALLRGDQEPEAPVETKEFQKLDAGQMKQISMPIGKSLEETIDLWRDVRREAISVPAPTTADQQLAATASAKIRETEAQLSIQRKAEAELNAATAEQRLPFKMASVNIPFKVGSIETLEKKQFTKAISAYTIQVEAKKKGYAIEWPIFSRTA
ncbi:MULTISPECIES: hypothetical protein [Sporosarcina]|uniref:Uncharacterized protein n=1 Tax=Sporosarcina contaminans TaxID=633403 RepID=A0ABW3TWP0_9BACL